MSAHESIETRYERLQALQARMGLTFSVRAPGHAGLSALSACYLSFDSMAGAGLVLVFDEYGDARPERSLLCAALLGRIHADMEHTGNVRSWAASEGVNDDETWLPLSGVLTRAWVANSEVFNRLNQVGCTIPDLVSPEEWQLGSGLAALLRA